MSKLQFIALITPSISSFVLIILAWIFSNGRLSDLRTDMNRQFDAVNRQFERVDRQFEKVDRQFEKVDRRFEKVEQHLERIDADLREFNGVTKRLEGRVDELSRG